MGVRKLDSQKYMKFKGKLSRSFLRLKFRIVDAQERTLSRKLGARGSGICATNLAEMAVKIALLSATQRATELRLETLSSLQTSVVIRDLS